MAADGWVQVAAGVSQRAGGLRQVGSCQCRQALQGLLNALASQAHEHGQLRLLPAHRMLDRMSLADLFHMSICCALCHAALIIVSLICSVTPDIKQGYRRR